MENEVMDSAQAREVLQKEAGERVERVKKGLQELLDKEQCSLDVSLLITTRGNIPQVNIVPR